MNWKILVAFMGGAALASGIVYMAVRPDGKAATRTLVVASAKPAPQTAQKTDDGSTPAPDQPPPVAEQQKSPVVSEETPPPPPQRRRDRAQVERPQPKRQVRNEVRTVQVARVDPPPRAVTPPPAPAPAAVVQTPVTTPPPAPAPEVKTETPKPEPPPPPAPEPHSVVLDNGTLLSVRIGETLSTKTSKPGDKFVGTLTQPLVLDGFVIAEKGSSVEGRVTQSDPGGRVKGVAELGIELTNLHTSDGQRIRIHTSAYIKDADTSRREDAAKVGGGAALGAIIGAIAGGGRGAGIGAAAGGAAGAGDVAMTRGKPAEIRVETPVSFRVQEPVTITERLQ